MNDDEERQEQNGAPGWVSTVMLGAFFAVVGGAYLVYLWRSERMLAESLERTPDEVARAFGRQPCRCHEVSVDYGGEASAESSSLRDDAESVFSPSDGELVEELPAETGTHGDR